MLLYLYVKHTLPLPTLQSQSKVHTPHACRSCNVLRFLLGFFWAVLIAVSTYLSPPLFMRFIIHHCSASQCIRFPSPRLPPSLSLSLSFLTMSCWHRRGHSPPFRLAALIPPPNSPSPICRSRRHPSAITHKTASRDEAAAQHTHTHTHTHTHSEAQAAWRQSDRAQSGEWVAACWACGSTNPRFDIACGTEVHSAGSARCCSRPRMWVPYPMRECASVPYAKYAYCPVLCRDLYSHISHKTS